MRVARAPLAPGGGYDVPSDDARQIGSRASTPPGTCETRRHRPGGARAVRTSDAWPAIQQAAKHDARAGAQVEHAATLPQRTPPTADLRLRLAGMPRSISPVRSRCLLASLALVVGCGEGQRRAAARTVRRGRRSRPKVAHDALATRRNGRRRSLRWRPRAPRRARRPRPCRPRPSAISRARTA